MGVKWLTSYVKNIQRAVSSSRDFQCTDESHEATSSSNTEDDRAKPVFVVDAWAFIFHVWLNQFGDSIRGLDFESYQELVRESIQVWLKAGIDVTFVFDGPFLPTKVETLVKRRAEVIAGIMTFIRSSAQSRTSVSFQRMCGIVPSLLFSATVDAVRSVQAEHKDSVKLVFAPTEADSLVAEIASECQEGYALSQDSDFFILCSRGQGCAGYVPLDSIEYVLTAQGNGKDAGAGDESRTEEDFDDGFQVVSSKKKKKGGQQGSIVSPQASTSQSTPFPPVGLQKVNVRVQCVRIQAYKAHDLAAYLQIPPTLLPLLAAIVGNDYTSALQSRVLLSHLSGPQRIPTVAERLRTEWVRMKNEARSNANGPTRRSHNQDFDEARSDIGSSATATPTRAMPGAAVRSIAGTIVPNDPVRSMVNAIVKKLLSQAETTQGPSRYIATGEHELVVDSIIDSAATYSLLTNSNAPHLASPSAVFFGDAIALLAGSITDRVAHPEAVKRYRAAYEIGHLREGLIEVVSQRVLLTRSLPEDPDVPSVQVELAREIRQWMYAVLFEVWGMSWARDTWEEPLAEAEDSSEDGSSFGFASPSFYPDRTYKDGEKPDDVISVNTESSESELDDNPEEPDELPSRPGSALEQRSGTKPAPGVTEYVRAGTTYSIQLVRITPLVELLREGGQNVDGDQADLPASLSGLLAQHEASQLIGEADAPRSDPAPSPVVLQPLDLRLDLFLYAMGAYTSAVRALPILYWLPAAALRAILLSETRRLGPNRLRYNWSRKELLVAVESMMPLEAHDRGEVMAHLQRQTSSVLPSTRAIHFATQIQLVLDTSSQLAQSLLLPVDEERWTAPHRCFSGVLFHNGLFRIHNGDVLEGQSDDESRFDHHDLTSGLIESVYKAVTEGVEDRLGIDEADLRQERKMQKAKKREQKAKAAATTSTSAERTQAGRTTQTDKGRNAFAALLASGEDA